MRRSVHRIAVAFCAALLLLTACQTVPHTSEVQLGLSNLEQAEKNVQFNPASPLPNAKPEDIARGFLAAAASAENNFAVAREYLTPVYAAHWDPHQGVLVDENSRIYTELPSVLSDGAVDSGVVRGKFTLTPVAHVNQQGFLTLAQPRSETTELLFEFVQVDGQWRINAAPAGIVLDRATFSAVWEAHPLTFLTPAGGVVEEQRWFARDTTQLTAALRQLLRGPQQQLATFTAFHDSTFLTRNVTVKSGEAVIEVTVGADSYSDSQLELLQQQLAGTLSGFDAVNTYKLVTETGTLLTGGVSRPDVASRYSAHFVLADGAVSTVTELGAGTPHPFSAQLAQLTPFAVTLQHTAGAAAVLNQDGVYLVNSGGSHLIDTREQLRAPTIDRWGFVWSATAQDAGIVQVSNASNKSFEFRLPSFAPHALHGIRMSPDGSQLAVLLATTTGAQVWVAQVQRDALGQPVQLSQQLQFTLGSADPPLDMDWLDSSRLALLTAGAGGNARVTVGGVGLFAVERGIVPGGVAIAGSWSTNSLRVLSSDGKLYRPQGSARWEQLHSDITLLLKNN